MVFFVALALGVSVYYNSDILETQGETPKMNLDIAMLLIAIISALAGAFFMFRTIDQERNVQFYEGEQILLSSTSSTTYACQLSIGDQDLSLEPMNANIYLTNLGILVERKGTGEAAVFIPIDMIREYISFQNGVKVRFTEPNMMFNEILLIVDNTNIWMDTLAMHVTG